MGNGGEAEGDGGAATGAGGPKRRTGAAHGDEDDRMTGWESWELEEQKIEEEDDLTSRTH